jgi:polar amino acid transport system substrate-binding protein
MPDANLDAVRAELAPSGTLRCALNHGNVVLVRRGPTDDTPSGVSPDLANELARRLGLRVLFRHFDKAEAVTDAAGSGDWDVCFLAIDPKRAETIAYSDPYVLIEGAYLVGAGSGLDTPDDLERRRPRIGAVRGSAYELHLTRTGRGGDLIRFATFEAALGALDAGGIDGLAGVRQAMERIAAARPAFVVMGPAFMTIPQAMGVDAARPEAARHVRAFVREAVASGFVRRSLDAAGQADAVVPPVP